MSCIINANNYHKTPRLTRPQSKLRQTQSELTVNLILRLHAPSAASPEEVWGIGLLHKDPLQWTCSGSRMRFSSQHKWNKRERMWKRCSWCSSSPCGSLAVPVLLGTAAESASGDTGSEDKTWRLKIRTEKLGSHAYLSMKYNQTKKTLSALCSPSTISLTHRKVQEAQRGEPRGLHTSRTSLPLCLDCWKIWVVRQTRRESKMYVRGGVGVQRSIDCLSEEREGVTVQIW